MEVRLGQIINKVGNSWVHMQEGRRLGREEKTAIREFHRVERRFGGVNGTEVTLDQIKEYLVVDLSSTVATIKALRRSWSLPFSPSPFVQRLEVAQDLQTPEGKAEATKRFNELREQDAELALYLLDINDKKNPRVIEHERVISAYDAAIKVLSL